MRPLRLDYERGFALYDPRSMAVLPGIHRRRAEAATAHPDRTGLVIVPVYAVVELAGGQVTNPA